MKKKNKDSFVKTEDEQRESVISKSNVTAPTEHVARRRSHRSSTLVSHALRGVVSDYIIAGPHGVLQQNRTSLESLFCKESLISLHNLLRLNLRDGTELPVLFEDAITETGHGCFQYKLMALCGFIYSCCSLSTTTLSFVLPAAQWDFNLTSADKGVLNTAPLCGMVVGAYIWGNFADSRGRRFVLFYSLMTDAFAAFLSSLCQNYTLFFICRVCNGFGIIGATSIVFAYLGEFLQDSKRDNFLSRLELFWTFGIIALPVIGFAILPREWEIGSYDVFIYNSWRIFVLACGIPSLLAALMILRMPESPRFLFLQGRIEKTKNVLIKMYVTNTRELPEFYPIDILHIDGEEEYYFSKLDGASRWAKIKSIFRALLKQHKELFRGRSLLNILISCVIDFCLMSVYYTLMLWTPELIHRQEQFLEVHNGTTAPLCTVVTEPSRHESNDKVDYYTLIHTLIICFACLPSNIILLCIIQYVSKKALLITLLVGAAGPAFALYFMGTDFEVTTVLCLFEAIATLIEAVLFCVIVEIFPLGTRGSALSLTVTIGRLGAVLGNVIFGRTLDHYCRELFFGMSGMLVLSGIVALLLPKMSGGDS